MKIKDKTTFSPFDFISTFWSNIFSPTFFAEDIIKSKKEMIDRIYNMEIENRRLTISKPYMSGRTYTKDLCPCGKSGWHKSCSYLSTILLKHE